MKINYITYQYFPDNRANTFQTFSTIKAFLRKDIEVKLIFPNRKDNNCNNEDYFQFYDVQKNLQHNLQIIPTKHINFISLNKNSNLLRKVIYLFQHYLWSKVTIKKLKLLNANKDEIFFTRSYIIFFLLRKYNCTLIFECHQLTRLSKILIKNTMNKIIGKKFIISLSPYIHNTLQNLGIPQNLILQLDNGYEESYFSNLKRTKLRKSFGFSENEKIFIFGGGLKIMNETKNLEFFIDVFNEYVISNKITDFKLLLYCLNETEYINLKKHEFSSPLNSKILIYNSKKEKEFIKLLFASDIGVIPLPDNFYVNHFSSSLKFSQYVRANLLIIGSNVGANKRMGYKHFIPYENNRENIFEILNRINSYDLETINYKESLCLSTDKRVEIILDFVS